MINMLERLGQTKKPSKIYVHQNPEGTSNIWPERQYTRDILKSDEDNEKVMPDTVSFDIGKTHRLV